MQQFSVRALGKIEVNREGIFIRLEPEYAKALRALTGFGHVQVLWWFDKCDNEGSRNVLEVPCPYKEAPEIMGTFATRSPERPNPLALSTVQVLEVDEAGGYVQIAYIDAVDGTPVVDIKPYTPSMDRVEAPTVPAWCAHWPQSIEVSGDFDWENEFNF